jgi:hypothetical protein
MKIVYSCIVVQLFVGHYTSYIKKLSFSPRPIRRSMSFTLRPFEGRKTSIHSKCVLIFRDVQKTLPMVARNWFEVIGAAHASLRPFVWNSIRKRCVCED